jgi:hypothetical protein
MQETSKECNKFSKRDFKSAKVWLLENNYPLDLIRGIIDFTIVDLANIIYNEQVRLNATK